MDNNNTFRITPQLVVGLIVILIGVIFTLDNLDIVDAGNFIRYWPVLLVVYGISRLMQPAGTSGRLMGWIAVAIGTLMLLHRLDIITFRLHDWWPVILIIVGGSLLFRSLRKHKPSAPNADADSMVNLFALFGGFERTNSSQDFRGGELTAVMGGCDLDLRRASITSSEAVVDIFALWGGIEIKIPEDWSVSVRAFPIMGGIEDRTHPPVGGSKKLLIVKGYAIMGGVEIKN